MARRITAEYKRECAELVIKHRYKYQDTADAMNVGLSSIQRWVNQYKEEQIGTHLRLQLSQRNNAVSKSWKSKLNSYKVITNY